MGPCGLRRMYRPICTWILPTISYNICYIMCHRHHSHLHNRRIGAWTTISPRHIFGRGSPRKNKGRVSIKVWSLPQETLSISMLDLRRRSIITSGSRVSSDYQYEGQCDYHSKVYSQSHGQVRQLSPSRRRERAPYHNPILAA